MNLTEIKKELQEKQNKCKTIDDALKLSTEYAKKYAYLIMELQKNNNKDFIDELIQTSQFIR